MDARRSWPVALAAGAAVALLSFLNAPPPGLIALVIGALMVASLRWRRGPILLPVAAAATFWLIALYYVVEQYRFRHAPGFAWPSQFESAHVFGLAVIFLLGAEVVRVLITRPADRRLRAHDRPPGLVLEEHDQEDQ
jgi:hypothetical protein